MQMLHSFQLLWIRRLSCDQRKSCFAVAFSRGPGYCRKVFCCRETADSFISSWTVCVIQFSAELHSYNATPDENANFLAKDVSFYSRVGFLSNLRGLWKTSGKSFQCIASTALHCCARGQVLSGLSILKSNEATSKPKLFS